MVSWTDIVHMYALTMHSEIWCLVEGFLTFVVVFGMYCRNQYYQPYKARRKSSNDQEGKTEELEEQDSQQVTSSTTTQENISSNKKDDRNQSKA